MLMQLAVYAGVPAASAAFRITQAELKISGPTSKSKGQPIAAVTQALGSNGNPT